MNDRSNGPIKLGSEGRTLADRVYEGIVGSIREGRVVPGERLVLHRIADDLGVSLSPVREAIARLAQDGLVEMQAHRGATVSSLTPDEVEEIYDVREALETFALGKAIERATPEHIAGLEEACNRMESQRESLTLTQWFELNREFHLLLVEPCGNRIVLETLRGLWDRQSALLMLATYTMDPTAVDRLLGEHRMMLEAFRTGRVDLARALMSNHIRDGRHRLGGDHDDAPHAQEVVNDG